MYMETPNQFTSPIVFSITVAAFLAFTLCLTAEFKKSKKNDLKLDGKLCYLPASPAFGLGIAALICLSIAQVIATFFISRNFCSRKRNASKVGRNPTVSCALLFFSWISFGVSIILISAATSMSQSQAFGEGWLDGECYLVKDGVYVGSAILALVALGSSTLAISRKETEEEESACKS
ncbi:hypothetical protein ACS0TY_011848 [Phlomoides rotata]